ncbi:MAG: YlxR family protein [Thermodesulfobacteriota bacterium]
MCAGCHRRGRKETFVRFVKSSNGTLFLDGNKDGRGRGYYLCPDRKCFKKAQRKIKGLGPLEGMTTNSEGYTVGRKGPV